MTHFRSTKVPSQVWLKSQCTSASPPAPQMERCFCGICRSIKLLLKASSRAGTNVQSSPWPSQHKMTFSLRQDLSAYQDVWSNPVVSQLVCCSHNDGRLNRYEAIGWDLATRCPMLRLKGHRKSLVAVSIVAMSGGTQRALTADLEGTFKLWEIRRTLTGMAPCLQTIDVSMQPATMEFISSNGCIISASSKMHILRPVQQKVQRDIPVCAIYNSVSMTICVAAGRNVRIYDATNGALRNEFFDIVPDEITSACLDHRQRKFIVGTAGGQVQVRLECMQAWLCQHSR